MSYSGLFFTFRSTDIKSIRKRFVKATKKIDAKLHTQVYSDHTREPESENRKDSTSTETANKNICLDGLPEIFHATSIESPMSRKSKSSNGHSVFESAAPAAISLVDDSDEEDDDDHAFDHPSTYIEQPWIWIPADKLGFSAILKGDLTSAGVNAEDLGAFMDWRGTVDVKRNPPDEEWQGGHDN